jgi:hypothetical protein
MRTLLALLVAAFLLPAFAQTGARPRPPGTLPLEEVPPPPPIPEAPEPGAAIEPQVTTRTEGDQTVQEYRHKGKLYMVRVTPRHGRPYVLVDQRGDGQFTRQDNPLDTGLRVPQWVILEF